MRPDPSPGQAFGAPRRGGVRWWVIALFAGYAALHWFGHRQPAAFTGRLQLVDTTVQQEADLGLQAYRRILAQAPLLEDGELPAQVEAILRRLVARAPQVEAIFAAERGVAPGTDWQAFDWQVSVIRSDEANAFCLPGGRMAVNTGLVPVAGNADALAVVMGHEMAHALLRHGGERMAQQKLVRLGQLAAGVALGEVEDAEAGMVMAALGAGAHYGLTLPFSRQHESEADEVGLMLAAAACFDPDEAPELWRRMAGQGGPRLAEFLSTHPDPATRSARLQSLLPKARALHRRFCSPGR